MQAKEYRKKIREYMEKNQMADCGDGILAAVSGGADSVCLLWILQELSTEMGFQLSVFHLNHGLRGEDAVRDEQYVESLCRQMGIPCRVVRADVRKFAKEEGLSEEEAGRILRYRYLKETAELFECRKIATAHHKDDNTETILMNLFRGTGLKGFGGIQAVRKMDAYTIIRPLLCLSRKEIESLLHGYGTVWCEDSTNKELQYTRNKVRNVMMPWIKKEINDRADDHVLQLAALALQADAYFSEEAEKILGENRTRISNAEFDAQPEIIKQYLVHKMIAAAAGQEKDITGRHVEAVCSLSGPGKGRFADLPYGLQAVRGYESIEVRRKEYGDRTMEFFSDQLSMRVFSWEKDKEIPKNQCTKWFDYDKIKGTLCVRTRESGDYFLYSGNKRKLLKRFFIDAKIPEEKRDQIPLLADGSHILWIVGHRISEYYKITDSTSTILEVTLCKGEKND